MIIGLLSLVGLYGFIFDNPHGKDDTAATFLVLLLSLVIGASPIWFWTTRHSKRTDRQRLNIAVGWTVPVLLALKIGLLIWNQQFNNSGEDGIMYVITMAIFFAADFLFAIGFSIIFFDRYREIKRERLTSRGWQSH